MRPIEPPQFAWLDASLNSPEDVLKSMGDELPSVLKGWIRLGVPVTRAVEIEDLDADGVRQLRAEAGRYRYDLVQLACALRPPKGERFRRAWVQVGMESPGAPDDAAIAWSMHPENAIVSSERKVSAGLGAQLGLVTINAGVENTVQREQASISALDVRTSNPIWELSRVDGRELMGSYFFALVVRRGSNQRTEGRVKLFATVERWRLFNLEANFPDAKDARFELGS